MKFLNVYGIRTEENADGVTYIEKYTGKRLFTIAPLFLGVMKEDKGATVARLVTTFKGVKFDGYESAFDVVAASHYSVKGDTPRVFQNKNGDLMKTVYVSFRKGGKEVGRYMIGAATMRRDEMGAAHNEGLISYEL